MADHGAIKAYSEDLRKKLVEAVNQRGTSKSEAARLFGISLSSVKRYTKLADRGEPLTPRKGRKLLEEDVRTRPSATIRETPLPGELRRQEPKRAEPEEANEEDGIQRKNNRFDRRCK